MNLRYTAEDANSINIYLKIFIYIYKDEEYEFNLGGNKMGMGGGAGSEHSNDTENADQKDLSVVYDEFREIFNEYKISEKDQVIIFKAFELKTEQDIKMFMQ